MSHRTPSPRDLRLAELVLEPRVFLQDDRPEIRRINSVYGLINLVRSLPPLKRVAEIGSFRGVSTEVLLLFAEEVIAVDPWHGFERAYQDFLQRLAPYHHLRVIREASVVAARRFAEGTFDLVYIDANHDYLSVKADLAAWTPKVIPGGWIAGHDYSPLVDGGQVIRAVDEVFGKPAVLFEDASWLHNLRLGPRR